MTSSSLSFDQRATPADQRITPRPTPRRPHRQLTDYAELLGRVQAQGLMERRYRAYAVKGGVLVAAFAAVWAGFFLLGESWLQLGVAAVFGVVLAQFGFLGHEAAHRQILRSGPRNETLARVVAGLFCGMSSTWWARKHTRHHLTPNQIGKDPDIEPSVLHFYPTPAAPPRSRVMVFLRAHQGWWFFPILMLEGLHLHIQGFRTVLGRDPVAHRWTELGLMSVRMGGYLAVLLIFLPVGLAAAFLGVQMAVLGVYLGCTFAPSHKGMPILPKEAKIDFLRRQVLMSRNITGSQLTTLAMGGLNYQIEHHLFPSMPGPNLRHAQVMIREFCRQRGVSYTETSLFASYGIVVRYLNRVGLQGELDTFHCPMVAAHRPV